jgi:hypothetical protein
MQLGPILYNKFKQLAGHMNLRGIFNLNLTEDFLK